MSVQEDKHKAEEDQADWAGLSVVERYRTSVGGESAYEGGQQTESPLAPLRRRIIASDLAIIVAVILLGLLLSSRASTWAVDPVLAIYSIPLIIGLLWFGFLALRGAYDQRILGIGTEEVKRVTSATIFTFAFVAGVSYLLRADISRAYAFISLPLGLILIAATRFVWRSWLYRARAKGRFLHRTVVIGHGQVVFDGTPLELTNRPAICQEWLGV